MKFVQLFFSDGFQGKFCSVNIMYNFVFLTSSEDRLWYICSTCAKLYVVVLVDDVPFGSDFLHCCSSWLDIFDNILLTTVFCEWVFFIIRSLIVISDQVCAFISSSHFTPALVHKWADLSFTPIEMKRSQEIDTVLQSPSGFCIFFFNELLCVF